ncbi:MAG: carbohydrate kinase family protein, partial [Salinibacterium sp.]|nr:carbohydrate kinase family protein [Salinibacterium sp.]
ITDGAHGSWLRGHDGTHHRQPALPTTVIDSTGAGDAFVAGFLAETLRDAAIPTRLLAAAACGARACEGRGDWRNAPTRRELENLLSIDSTDSTEPIER